MWTGWAPLFLSKWSLFVPVSFPVPVSRAMYIVHKYVYCYESNLFRPVVWKLADIETLAVLTVRDWNLHTVFCPSLWPAGQSCQTCGQTEQYLKSGSAWIRATEGKGITDPRWVWKKALKPSSCSTHHAGLMKTRKWETITFLIALSTDLVRCPSEYGT